MILFKDTCPKAKVLSAHKEYEAYLCARGGWVMSMRALYQRLIKNALQATIFLCLGFGLVMPGAASGQPTDEINDAAKNVALITFNVNQTAQAVLGVGANIFTDTRDILYRPAASSGLGVSWVRWWVGGSADHASSQISAGSSFDDFYSWWKQYSHITNFQSQDIIFKKYGIHKIATMAPPSSWLDPKNNLIAGNEAPCADFAAAGLKYLHDKGIDLDYIEFFNEPDGNWNAHLTPAQLDMFSAALAQRIKTLHLNVGVMASGLSHMDDASGDTYLPKFRTATLASLDALSVHTYEWSNTINSVSYFAPHMATYMQSIASLRGTKPVFATEYAPSKAGPYHGITYSKDQTTCYENSVNDDGQCFWTQRAYAARLFSMLLQSLNAGISVTIVWWGYDYNWGPHNAGQSHGLISAPSRGSSPRPSFYMLQTLYPKIANGRFKLLSPPSFPGGSGIKAAAFISGSTVVVSIVNDSDAAQDVHLGIEGTNSIHLESAQTYAGSLCNGELCSYSPTSHNSIWIINLPIDSGVTSTFSIGQN